MNIQEKIKEVKNIAGGAETLSWKQLCDLTSFDSFMTTLAFGMQWNEKCPSDIIETMDESFLSMIIFNVNMFPKSQPIAA